MPNHVHTLLQFAPGVEMGEIVNTWKDATAHQANAALERSGAFWQADYFDRYIRDAAHYENTLRYIKLNPVRAGLVKNANQYKWLWLPPGNG